MHGAWGHQEVLQRHILPPRCQLQVHNAGCHRAALVHDTSARLQLENRQLSDLATALDQSLPVSGSHESSGGGLLASHRGEAILRTEDLFTLCLTTFAVKTVSVPMLAAVSSEVEGLSSSYKPAVLAAND